jgi:protein-S-isoprenylcysteine O-methyltransferase Ste14
LFLHGGGVEALTYMKLIIFVIGTLGIIYFSWWASIKDRRYHGVYRFFAFESILGLILVNLSYWFLNPFSLPQFVSWISLVCSVIVAIQGFYLLRVAGEPKEKFENTTKLVDKGIYRYIRHPLYLSLILLGWGAYLKNLTVFTSVLFLINLVALLLTAKSEEKEMIGSFGEEYILYMRKTKIFVPFIF